jgi:hypothetical protein
MLHFLRQRLPLRLPMLIRVKLPSQEDELSLRWYHKCKQLGDDFKQEIFKCSQCNIHEAS